MKKLVSYFFVGLCIMIIVPILCTRKANGQNNVEEEISKNEVEVNNNEEIVKFDYTKFATIKLYHTKDSSVEELPIDQYLYGVVSAEMPASYEVEALKAQAIVARTYTIYQISKNQRKTSRWRYMW